MLKFVRHLKIIFSPSTDDATTISPQVFERMTELSQLRTLTVNHDLLCQPRRNDGRALRNKKLLDSDSYIEAFADRAWEVVRVQCVLRRLFSFTGIISVTGYDLKCSLAGGKSVPDHCVELQDRIHARFAEKWELEKEKGAQAKTSELNKDGQEGVSNG
jgi:hypothetical protein